MIDPATDLEIMFLNDPFFSDPDYPFIWELEREGKILHGVKISNVGPWCLLWIMESKSFQVYKIRDKKTIEKVN